MKFANEVMVDQALWLHGNLCIVCNNLHHYGSKLVLGCPLVNLLLLSESL